MQTDKLPSPTPLVDFYNFFALSKWIEATASPSDACDPGRGEIISRPLPRVSPGRGWNLLWIFFFSFFKSNTDLSPWCGGWQGTHVSNRRVENPALWEGMLQFVVIPQEPQGAPLWTRCVGFRGSKRQRKGTESSGKKLLFLKGLTLILALYQSTSTHDQIARRQKENHISPVASNTTFTSKWK